MNSLRTRLLISYVLIIVVTLAVIAAALLLLLRSRPVPVESVYQRLDDVARGVTAQLEQRSGQPRFTQEQIEYMSSNLAESTGLRLLIVQMQQEPGNPPRVVFDSLGVMKRDTPLPAYHLDERRSGPDVMFGSFKMDGEEWLFTGRALGPGRFQPSPPNQQPPQSTPSEPSRVLLFATPRPNPNLNVLLNYFDENLLMPMLQAGAVGLAVAVVLALLITRSVARPLQQMARAAGAVAAGDFDQQTSEEGPDEVQTVARAFNHMAQQVKANRQAQRDFLANVSHDLRTPLTSIQGFSQAILDGAAAHPEGTARAAAVIHDEAARMGRMVEDLLDLARIESGQLDMARQIVNPAAILQALGERFALQAEEQELTLLVQVPDLPDVTGDGDRLAQVFTNLLDNALKHTPAGGTITLRGGRVEGGIELSVADTGEGIPPEDLERVFERFYQVDKSRQRGERRKGAGLGLAISREIIEAHGGTIRAESVLGIGTRFVVRLPLS